MLSRVITFLFLLLCVAVADACEVIDDTGQKIQLSQPARRIISFAPDLTELLFAAGAGQFVVGVVRGSDYPKAALAIPIIANYNSLDSEAILALHPDLIVAWEGGNTAAQLQLLRRMHVPVFFSHQRELSDIPKTLRRLGCLAGTAKIANNAADNFSERYHALQERNAQQKRVTVFYEIWPHPLTTVNQDSWINQLIVVCGGRNIFATARGVAPEVNPEAVIAANPDVIISTAANWKKMWSVWPQMTAVRDRHLFSVNADWVERAGPRLLDGAEQVCQDLQYARAQTTI